MPRLANRWSGLRGNRDHLVALVAHRREDVFTSPFPSLNGTLRRVKVVLTSCLQWWQIALLFSPSSYSFIFIGSLTDAR